MKSVIDEIYKDGLCLGCGLCESICGKDSVEMQLQNDGFFRPLIKSEVKAKDEDIIRTICPGLNVVNDLEFGEDEQIWGKAEKLYSGFSTDKEIRTKGSSGGMISAIAIYLLDNGIVDAVLQVGGYTDDYERNSLRMSKSRTEVLSCASSRYAPALIFDRIFDLLNSGNDRFCFIGKPCDISALKNFLTKYPQYQHRFYLTLSIMCAGMPSFQGTKKIIEEFKAVEPVKNLVYRGNGWPGFFSFKDKNESVFKMTYNDSWGKRLGKFVHNRCKICPDGIGLQADIAVGDAWETSDGYPDFTEREGNSLIISRTPLGTNVLHNMRDKALAEYSVLNQKTIAIMQPFQNKRRQRFGVRVLAFSLAKRRLLNFKNVNGLSNARQLSLEIIAREFWGMFKRSIR